MDNFLREWRLAKGMTQQQVASALKVTKGEISRLESGERSLRVEWINALAKIYKETPANLLINPNAAALQAQQRIDYSKPEPIGGTSISVTSPNFALLRIEGDEMEPVLRRGDIVGYDTGRTSPSPSGLFVVQLGGAPVARRLHAARNVLRVMCDNPVYGESEEPLDAVTILGRITFVSRPV